MRLYTNEHVEIDPNIMMRINRDSTLTSETHRHDFVEVQYILSGKSTQVLNGTEYVVEHGSVVIIPVGSSHSYKNSTGAVIINLLFTNNILRSHRFVHQLISKYDILSSAKVVEIPPYFLHEFENIVLTMERECKDQNLEYFHMLAANVQIFFCYLARALSNEQPKSFSSILHNLDKILIEGGDFSLKNISAMFNYNPNYFSSLFKKIAGMTYSEYIDKRRVEFAISKLLYTDYTVENIYRSVGFRGKRHFYDVFRKQTGMSPTQYRRQAKDLTKKGIQDNIE